MTPSAPTPASSCCMWPRVLYHNTSLTLYSSLLLAAALAIAGAESSTWAKAAAIFCGGRLGWYLWVARPSSLDVGAGPPPAGPPAPNCKALTTEQLEFFDRCGYLVLSQVVPKAEADKFVSETIVPGLLQDAGIDIDDTSGWHTGEKWQIVLPGCCRGHKNVANHNRCGAMCSAVPDAKQIFPLLFDSNPLLDALDDLHGVDEVCTSETAGAAEGSEDDAPTDRGGAAADGRGRRWEWLCGATPTLGATHIRYPLPKRQPWTYPAQAAAKLWAPPVLGWHIDGAHFQGHRVGSTQQSIIVLPVFGNVEPGGGATAIVAGSHKVMGEFLQRHEPAGCAYMKLFLQAHWVYNAVVAMGLGKSRMTVVQAAPCKAGDVLIMHPFLVHSASLNYSLDMRYAFNLGVRWRTPPTAAPVTDGVNRDSATDETPAAVAEAETQSLLVGAAEENMLSTLGQNMAALTEQYRSAPEKLALLPRTLARFALQE